MLALPLLMRDIDKCIRDSFLIYYLDMKTIQKKKLRKKQKLQKNRMAIQRNHSKTDNKNPSGQS